MPVNANISAPEADWVELTTNDATRVSVTNNGPQTLILQGSSGSVKPDINVTDGPRLPPNDGISMELADLFPGIAGVNRLWGRGAGGATNVWRCHA